MKQFLVLMLLAGPAAAQTAATPSDNLAAALKSAPNEAAALALEAQIREMWAHAGTPAVRLLVSRGTRELSEGAPGDALDSFDAALDLSPDLLDGWRGRAAARRSLGDYVGAVRDLQELLRREPNSFIAFQDLSRVAEARGDWRSALIAWQKLLDLDPQTPGGQTRLRDLKRRALGEQL
jgi:tetratricopeptide (TPR) repeat protein